MGRLLAALWLALALLLPGVAAAQEERATAAEISAAEPDDPGFLTRLLQENLSGAGREVRIEGFRGALSSRATFTRLTIADDEGVWLEIENGAIQWNRSALFARRVEIAELSAETILLPRLPAGDDTPTPEAGTGFSLPTLPVGVTISHIDVGRVEIGQPVIGQAAVVSVDGSMSLARGEGEAQLAIERIDGPRGVFAIDASYSNATTVLGIDITLDEAPDGILANLIDLEGRPAVQATIQGEGPLDDFSAEISLGTDGQPRVTGTVALASEAGADGTPGRGFRIHLGGDVGALIPEAQRGFFGDDSQLLAQGWLGEDGRLDIPVLLVDTEGLNLSGSLSLNAERAPTSAVLLLTLGEDAGATDLPVRLPLGGTPTTVQTARLQLSYDAAEGSGWTLRGFLGGYAQERLAIESVTLDGSGTIRLEGESLAEVVGQIGFETAGIAPANPDLAAALGPSLNGSTTFDWTPGNAVEFPDFTVAGDFSAFEGQLLLDGLGSGITVSGRLDARYDELERLSGLAGRPLQGRVDGEIAGFYTLLTGGFDAEASFAATDIRIGQEQLDRLLRGNTTIVASARRDEQGIELRELTVDGERLTVDAAGTVSSGASNLRATLTLASLAEIDPALGGSLAAEATLTGAEGQRRLAVNGQAVDLETGIAQLDGALRGTTDLVIAATEAGGQYTLQRLELTNPQLTLEGEGDLTPGQMDASLQLTMGDLADLQPGWGGSLAATGRIAESGGLRRLTLTGTGEDLRFGQQDVDGALTGTTSFTLAATQDPENGQIEVEQLDIENPQLTASASGPIGQDRTDLSGRVDIASLAAFGRGWRGSLQAQGRFADTGDGGRRLEVTGTGQDLALGQQGVDEALTGATTFTLAGVERDGSFTIETAEIGNQQLTASATGQVGAETQLQGAVSIARLEALGLGARGSVALQGSYAQDADGQRRIDVTGTGEDLALGQEQVDGALTGTTRLSLRAVQGPDGFVIEEGSLVNDQIDVTAQGTVGPEGTDLTGYARAESLASLGLGWGGSVDLTGSFRDAGDGTRRLEVAGTAQDVAIGQPQVDGLLRGTSTVAVRATERDGAFAVEEARIENPQASITATGTVGGGVTDMAARIEMPSLAALGPGWAGALAADGTLVEDGSGMRRFTLTGTGTDLSLGQTQVDAALAGVTRFDIAGTEEGGTVTLERAEIANPRLTASATGRIGGGVTDLQAQVDAESLAFIGGGLRGGLTASGQIRQQGDALTVTASGTARNLGIGNPQLDLLLGGTTSFDLAASRQGEALTINRLTASNPQASLTASGTLAGGITVDARLANLGLFTPAFPGPVQATGTVRQAAAGYGLDLAISGPGGTQTRVAGTVAQDGGTADLAITGTTDAAIANPTLRVRSVTGPVSYDLRLNGPLALESLSGRVTLSGAQVSDPRFGVRIDGLDMTADLSGGSVAVRGGGGLADGGTVAVQGTIGIANPRPIDMTVRLDEATLRDPNLYETSLTGTVTATGTLAEGPLIAGSLAIGRTEIRIPSTGLGGAAPIPDITHLGDRPPVRATRAKAGLLPYPGAEATAAGLAGPPASPPTIAARLDLTLEAPNQVFIRGRGVDAELGGTIRLTGSARNVVPVGSLSLIRGRVDLLGRRFVLSEGSLEMQGSLVPYIRLVAETQNNGIVTRIEITGEANDPTITFTSIPDMPQEEVLSQLLFGRGIDNISALQAAQLANAVATLAGRGGEGIVAQLREGFGLDDLDLQTDEDGDITVRAGRYISDRVYTDLAVGGDGKTQLNINLDLTDSLTARGSVDNEGESSLGLFFERDY
ncbi:DUF490 domain-containing protein [Paracoccus sp. S-4012]|uniref:translocation/assembly module TamB domain-containing protein n=1 Tax=Paracoccus sp. S-4012 TaxID=2665648 RepID=UPI0012AF00EC|nr:translocation/assembly module TamB domain-containing protein [Paracoccus sp. S-4012]MRX49819.1 DUF490 domain-containing protein [Paracoccus sp. S-4012]